jgi:hypothetical protein
MFDLFKKKKLGAYDTEYFKNKVLISELEEKRKIQRQRDEIARLRKQSSGVSGKGIDNFMKEMGAFGHGAELALGTDPQRKKGKKDNHSVLKAENKFFNGGMF